jgi:hypothetical protein
MLDKWRRTRRLNRSRRKAVRRLETHEELWRRTGADEETIAVKTESERHWVDFLDRVIKFHTGMNRLQEAVALDIDMLHLEDECCDNVTGLSCRGRNTVLSLLRKEKNERVWEKLRYVTLLAPVVGTIAAVVALIMKLKQ